MTTILKPILVEELLKERFNVRDLRHLQGRDWSKVINPSLFSYLDFHSSKIVKDMLRDNKCSVSQHLTLDTNCISGQSYLEECPGGNYSYGSVKGP